ncbi:unnamed protein product [Brassicogethes aeneus]|uniref:XPG N-terminal domain-containing protein n=1 Tax=Brassicogethes aeneus TaxID=1431903 RepID=A0A9P0AWF5_BRAAE|nr:unnamed protein product [Brassicogethes aeneus]
MGIKHLWSILGPYYERKPLFELQGKTVAVDLSCWICEAQNIAEYQVQPRMYLRNLYFRTAYLLLMEVYPVFVLEGKAPELKYETIAARNAIQFKDLGRNKLVTMALILGSDYSDGVPGIGKDSIMKFFENVSDAEVLDRLRQWRANEALYKKYEEKINDKNICTSCGHHGKVQGHTRNGCISCGTNKGCDSSYKEKRLIMKNEVNMRSKSILDPEFPKEALITEYLTKKDNVSKLDIKWKQPNLVKFVQFSLKFLGWEEIYSVEKILPILTRWQVMNADSLKSHEHLKGVLVPDRIKKVRNPKGIPSYEIIWSDPHEYFKYIIPESQLENQDLEKIWSSIEPQNLVQKAYPELVEAFNQSKIKPKKITKRKPKVTVDELGEMLKNTSIEVKAKKPRKPRQTKKTAEENKIQNYFKNDEIVEIRQSTPIKEFSFDNLEEKLKNISITEKNQDRKTPKQNITSENYLKKAVINSRALKNHQSTPAKLAPAHCDFSFDMDMSKFGDEDDLDVSDIVDNILKKKPDYKDILSNLNLDKIEDSNCVNSSSFFVCNPEEGEDIFEKTFNLLTNKSSDDNEVVSNDENINNLNENDDSFCDIYVPLYERIKMKNK